MNSFIDKHVKTKILSRMNNIYNIGKISYGNDIYYLNIYYDPEYSHHRYAVCIGGSSSTSDLHRWINDSSNHDSRYKMSNFLKDIVDYMLHKGIIIKPK